MQPLNASIVNNIFVDCLTNATDLPGESATVEGVLGLVSLNIERLKQHHNAIGEQLSQLPLEFYQTHGGGMSFLNACVTRNGEQWGEHTNINQLLMMGLALGAVAYCMPRNMWSMMPGGMPYFMVKDYTFVDSDGVVRNSDGSEA